MWKLWILVLLISSPLLGQEDEAAMATLPLEERVSWQSRDELDGRFSITTPGRLEHRIDTVTTAVGEQFYHTYFFKAPPGEVAENLIYVLSYVDYPAGALPADSTQLIEDFFVATEESAAEALRGEVIYATPREVLGYPGRLWRINYRDGEATARTLAFLIDRRYYELKTFALSGRGLGESTDRFFESFRYLGRQQVSE
jgi:hypothetical protein